LYFSVPPVFDVGYCLVGGCQVTQFVIKNKGGHGRFCILPSSAWPTTNFKVQWTLPGYMYSGLSLVICTVNSPWLYVQWTLPGYMYSKPSLVICTVDSTCLYVLV